MSWEEFKKKQQQTSSWQEFKNRQENRVQQTTKKQETSLWQDIQNFANGAGKASENLFLSAKNGVMSFMQTMQRNNANVQADTADRMNKLNQEMLEKKIKSNPEYSEEIKNVINNPLISSEEIKQKSKENYEEVQAKKSQNILKMQENTDSINNPIGKKIVGEIAPGIGQMLPGMVGGPIGTAYFLGSATGNYYDDALQRGMNEEQAKTYSGIMGAIEGSLESIGANLTKNVGKQLLKKNIKGALINYGLDIGENFLEESIVELLSEITSQTIAGKDKADWSNIGQRMWDSGVTGALISAITGGASGAVGAIGSKATQQNTYKDYNTNKSLNKDSQNWLKQAEDIIGRNSTSNLKPQSFQSQQNISTKQITQVQQENAQNTNMKTNKMLPMQNYVYEKSDNVKIDKFRQSASQNFDNSIESRNYLNMLERIITDKDVDIIFDANLKDSQGRVANGSYSNGVITINPNSNRAGEFIAIHELTHAIGTNQMRNIVEQYRKSNTEFNVAVEQLLKNYNTTEITEEAMADVSAQLFGNQEFINNIAQNNPNIFQKIYSEIKYLWHQFRGYKNQDQFIEDLYYKWTQAYNSNSKLNASENYSIAGKQGMDNAIKNNPINISLERAYNRAQQMQKIGMDNETIRKQTNWFQDRNGDWKFEFSDRNMTLKNIKINQNEIYKLKDILKHDTLFIAYPQLENLEIRFKDLNKTNGSYNKKNNYISLNNKLIGSRAKIEGTIIHEIQHAIQNIEGFENGITSKLSKKIYYESLGEIEAADTKKRFIDEKYKKKNISNIAPESSKANPKHRNYDNYINNRGLLDKVKDSVFKYFKGSGDGNEIIQENLEQTDEETLRSNNEKVWDRLKNDIEESENNSGSFNLSEINSISDITNKYKDKAKYLILNEDDTKISINNMVIKEELRNKGIGQNILNDIIEYANKNNKTITLTPTSEFNTKDRLKKWYKKNGFVENKGKNTNFLISDTMYKLPNPNSKYSLPTKEWQQHLEENYKPTGTRTNLEDIRLPVKEDSTKSSFNLPPANEEAKVANILNKPAEKVKEKDRSWAIIKANVIDKGMVFEELSRKTGNRKLQGKWDYTLTSTARGQNAVGNARYELDPNTKTQKQISKSLTDIIDEVGENTSDFYAYMYHQLNIDRMTLEDRFDGDTGINYERKKAVKNKPVFGEGVTAEISRKYVQELEQKHPEFKEWAQDVYEYLDANTKELVESGVISKETQELFKEMYPHYVPISRVTNKGQAINVPLDTGRTGINSPIKKATGGNKDINPLFETMADRTLQTYRAAARNSFGVELKNAINQNKQSNQTSEQVDIDIIMENMTDEEQNKQLLQEGKNGEKPTFTVFENGNKVTYEITKDMYDALKPKNDLLAKIDENKVSKVANKINNFRRGLLTEYNPVFSITNAIKDAQDILLNSQHSAKTYAKILEATAQLLSKGYWYNEYIQNGGAQNSYFKDGEFETTKNNLPTKIKNTLTFPLRAISNVNNVIEMAPRLAEYIASREQGRSIETSMLDAARVTTNFKAGGDVTKTLNRNGFTFLNASVQGMQQQIRNIQEANAKGLKGYAVLACKYAIAAAPVLLLNNLIWADDDDYEELQDYVKDNYYIIGKSSNGKFLRIPKGRAVATIQKIVSNVNDFVKNDTINSDEVGKVFWEDMKENIQFGMDNLAPNNPLENNILSPIFQAITNKTWYGEDLVPSRLQKKPSEEQYDESTDNFSRWLGEKTGISPIKINYLIDQYSGGVGDILLPLGTPQAENNVIEDKFTTDATMKSKYPGEFFSKVDELEINKNSSKATDEDILKYKYIDSVSTDIGELYTKKREIQNSSATDKEKKAQLKEVQEQINELAKNSLEAVEKIQNTSTTARIGDKEYYKYHGEWTSLSEEETKKNKKLSLKTYADYKNKVYNQTQAKRASGELEENQSLKNKDKIGILLNSKYPNSEISAIYDNYIRSSNDTEYTIMKSTDIDIKEYLGYKQQEFTSDKIDDGTLKEKTVSKSEQKKVVEYLNSMNIKGNQRLLLYAMRGYTTTSSQKTQLANYVKTLKIDKDTKLELYDKFSGFTVYKDGTVSY